MIVFAGNSSTTHWESLQTIGTSLKNKIPHDFFWDQSERTSLPGEVQKVIMGDHRWLTSHSLEALKTHPEKLEIVFYIFGDFTLKLRSFEEHLRALSRHKLSFVVASKAQKNLVAKVFPEISSSIRIEDYPVDERLFQADKDQRKKLREKYSIAPSEQVFGFAGRISRQKGVLELLRAFLEEGLYKNARLMMAGPVHPHPFWQFSEDADEAFLTELKKLTALAEEKVIHLGQLDRSAMRDFYSAIDVFVSPGYFHDEDFNLTVSEARAAGKPCIISRWGGHTRLLGEKDVKFVNMTLDKTYKVSLDSLKAQLGSRKDETQVLFGNSLPLSPEKRKQILENTPCLTKDGIPDFDLYQALYSSYL